MNARVKFFAGGVLILGTAAYLMTSSISETGMTWMTPTELAAKTVGDTSFTKRTYKVGVKVVSGTITRGSNGREIAFVGTDGARHLKVLYNKIPPDTFTDSADVVLTGKLLADGTFEASELFTKCSSRFEVAPPTGPEADKYRSTPGYKAVKKVGT